MEILMIKMIIIIVRALVKMINIITIIIKGKAFKGFQYSIPSLFIYLICLNYKEEIFLKLNQQWH